MLIDRNDSTLLLIDIQEKLIKKIFDFKSVIDHSKKVVDIFSLLKIPIIYSEQYPNGLGKTINSLDEKLKKIKALKIEKTTFSCISNKDNNEIRVIFPKNQIIICGIETHICVLQTAVDLKNLGYQVFIVEDAVGSRNIRDKKQAIKRLLKYDVSSITLEMLIFELVRDYKHEHFKELSNIIK